MVSLPLRLALVATLASLPFSASQADIQRDLMALGQQQYALCMTCHGPDGKGMKAADLLMAPPLAESVFLKSDDAELATLIVLKGIKKEDPKYVQQMVGLSEPLDDRKLAAVLTYVRNTFAGRDDFVSPEAVAKWRKKYAKTPALLTRKQLDGLVLAQGFAGGLQDLTYKAYAISVQKLPDFRKLEPAHEGEWKSGLLDLDAAGKDLRGKNFALVFEGNLVIPKTGKYQFQLSSDDGARLLIDGEVEIDHDGIHPSQMKESKPQELVEGIHSVRVEYFEGGGQEALALAVKPAGTNALIALSKEAVGGKGGGKKPAQSIPLLARNPGEAVLYRNFIDGSLPRAIAVGYPGGVNLCWDADSLNLAMLWRGDFMDAGRHWTGRGQGAQKPMGTDVVGPAKGHPLQVLESPDAPWLEFSKAKIKYEKDSDDPQKEITYNTPHPDYKFHGYKLDKRRFPTFRYSYKGLEVEDHFEPVSADGVQGFRRTIRFRGKPDAHTAFRIAKGAERDENGLISLGKLLLSVGGKKIPEKHGNDLVIPVEADSQLMLLYRWMN